jgi:Kef-type K+ transport system membrane component KefB
MPEVSLSGVVLVSALAFGVPFLLGLAPGRLFPAVVAELALGAALGPSGAGILIVDLPLELLSILGLAFLLFLAGLEIDPELLRGRLLFREVAGFALSLLLAVGVVGALGLAGLLEAPLLVAVALTSTSLGVVVPVLKDAGRAGSRLGQLLLGGAAIADLGGILLLTLIFGPAASTPLATGLLLLGFLAVMVALGLGVAGIGHQRAVATTLTRLQDTSGQVRVRGAWVLLVGCTWLAQIFGIELLLGAFLAGVVLRLVDREAMTHPVLHAKLEGAGYGIFVPFFFVVSGARLDLGALVSDLRVLMLVPLLLGTLIIARGLPALLYRPWLSPRELVALGLLQATSLPFLVAVAELGRGMGLLGEATAGALVVAGLLSVSLLPLAATLILRTFPDDGTVQAGSPASVEPPTSEGSLTRHEPLGEPMDRSVP